jgi:hypothetical protein
MQNVRPLMPNKNDVPVEEPRPQLTKSGRATVFAYSPNVWNVAASSGHARSKLYIDQTREEVTLNSWAVLSHSLYAEWLPHSSKCLSTFLYRSSARSATTGSPLPPPDRPLDLAPCKPAPCESCRSLHETRSNILALASSSTPHP